MASRSNGIGLENLARRVQRRNASVQRKRKMTRRQKPKPLKWLFSFLTDYCSRSSLHGLRYIVEPGIHWVERLIWALIFTVSVLSAVSVIFKLSARFQTAETSTVVETTNHLISEIPFPSVTLCPSNRVDWHKALEMEKKIVPTHDLEAVQTYRELVTTLSTITFGDFERLAFLENRSLEVFHGLNLTNFLRSLAPTCSELLSDCWWRNSNRDCCEIFEQQRTEYGFCYSFNSESADFDESTYSKELRPRRTNSIGDWSGIRFSVNLNKSNQPPETNKALGVITFVGHPSTWPSSGRNTGVGTMATISVQCPSTYATDSVLQLGKDKLPCHESNGTDYIQDYCFTICRRKYIILRCGCNPTFLMPIDSARDCSFDDLMCLARENGTVFTCSKNQTMLYTVGPTYTEIFFNATFETRKSDLGMKCNCLPECNIYQYVYQITHAALRESIATNTIFIDVHYASFTMIRYRMDIVHTPLDLLVSFGGVVGLFLGGSILSLIELVYHLTMGLLSQVFYWPNRVQKPVVNPRYPVMRVGHETPVSTVYTVWPLMDYHTNPRVKLRKC